jgi:hypothetical protein
MQPRIVVAPLILVVLVLSFSSSSFARQVSWGVVNRGNVYVITPGGFKNPPGQDEGAGVVVDPIPFRVTGTPGEGAVVAFALPDSFAQNGGDGILPLKNWTYGFEDYWFGGAGPITHDTVIVPIFPDGTCSLRVGGTVEVPSSAPFGVYSASVRAWFDGRDTVVTCTLRVVPVRLVAPEKDLYPLRVGNSWFYRSVTGFGGVDTAISSSVTVVGDSLFENGHRYFVLSEPDIYGSRFVRKDSASVHYINPNSGLDQEVFRLDGHVGDTVLIDFSPLMWVTLTSVDTVMVLGYSCTVYTYRFDGLATAEMRLCDQLGPILEWRYSDPAPPWPDYGREIAGCRIYDLEYGITLGVEDAATMPEAFRLEQNYPNPFNPVTTISYTLPVREHVSLRVFDVLGREVATLIDGVDGPGERSVRFDAGRLPSGVYFYRLRAGERYETRKLLLMK